MKKIDSMILFTDFWDSHKVDSTSEILDAIEDGYEIISSVFIGEKGLIQYILRKEYDSDETITSEESGQTT